MTEPAIVGTMTGHRAPRLFQMIFLVTTDTPPHGQGFNPPRRGHGSDIAMAVPTDFTNRSFFLEVKTLNMALMVETNEIRQVMHLFPGNGLLVFPIFKQFLDARTILDAFNQIVTPHAFVETGNPGYIAAPRIGMTVHAVDLHASGMGIVWKLDGLLHHRAQGIIPVTGL